VFFGLAAAGLLAAVSAATAAGPSSLNAIEQQRRAAVLDLYALESHGTHAQQRLDTLQGQAASLRAQQLMLREQLGATHTTLLVSRRTLGDNLRRLYKQGDVNTLAIVLGAQSLDDAVSQIDTLSAVADESRQVATATTRAERRLSTLRSTMAARGARLAAAVSEAQRTLNELVSARAQRISFVAQLRTKEQLKRAQIAALEARVQQAQQTSAALTAQADPTQADPTQADPTQSDPAPAADPASSPAPEPASAPGPAPERAPSGGRTLTVGSTGYSLPGHTATGLPVGWGVVAVDPSVIPLGTKLTIPGYGEAVAADTGGAVHGNVIDLWFPTLGQARAWGRRTVTITLH
jgi:3D (Asp-Asp-Asp) domain-containing protein/peptidoglycan hydrolase CwlO-like protein